MSAWARANGDCVINDLRQQLQAEPSHAVQAVRDLYDSHGGFVPDYSSIVENLKPGDQIRLPSQRVPGGRVFTVFAVPEHGATTRVIDIGGESMLRVPINDGATAAGEHNLYGAERSQLLANQLDFATLQSELKAAGVRVVDIDPIQSEAPFGLVVKKEKILFNSLQFFRLPQAQQSSKAREAYLRFLDGTWNYTSIGDFNGTQIIYNGEEWVLIDFGHSPSIAQQHPLRNFRQKRTTVSSFFIPASEEGSALTYRFVADPNFVKEAAKRVRKIRAAVQDSRQWFERSDRYDSFSRGTEFIDRITPYPLPASYVKDVNIPGHTIRIEVKNRLETSKNTATYQVLVNGKYPARLKTLIKARESIPAEIWDWVKKARKKKKAFLAGSDFILYYDAPVPSDLLTR